MDSGVWGRIKAMVIKGTGARRVRTTRGCVMGCIAMERLPVMGGGAQESRKPGSSVAFFLPFSYEP